MPGIARTRSLARSPRPWPLLAALCAVQLLIGIAIALSATHNHFVWYSGGDSTEYWTAAWSLAHGELPQSIVGYGVPVLYAWVPLITGTTLLGGLPVIAVLQLVVLVPLALVLFWAVADLLFGRMFAWWAAVLWILAPLLMLLGFGPKYSVEFKNLFVAPHWYGLTNMADLPSLVCVLAVTWATLRLLQRRTIEDGVLAGLLTGALIGLKPANGFFLPALAILLVAVRELRPLLAWGAGFLPGLITLALWKERGLGRLPITSATGSTREAAGAHPLAVAGTGRYLQFDWSHFHTELLDLREVFWSYRLLEFLAIAGVIAVLRRAPLKGAFVGVWFLAFCIVKGSSERSSITSVSYWRFVEPGLPAFVLLVAGLVFLLPRRGRAWETVRDVAPVGRGPLVAAAVLLGAVPLVLMVAAQPAPAAHYARVNALANDAPLADQLALSTSRTPNGVLLSWHPVHSGPTKSYYAVYRAGSQGCTYPTAGARECQLDMTPIAMTRSTSLTDANAGAGRHWYRVALMANYQDALDGSDLMLVGPATSASR